VEEIEKAGATLAFVTEPHQSTPEGQLLTFVRGWASKLEALKIKERTGRGMRERNRKGLLTRRRWPGPCAGAT
ncbi:MAG: recombinase family protein, partial [Chloroflexota bacterium]